VGCGYTGTVRLGEPRTCRLSTGTVRIVETGRVVPAPILVSRIVVGCGGMVTVIVTVTVVVGLGGKG